MWLPPMGMDVIEKDKLSLEYEQETVENLTDLFMVLQKKYGQPVGVGGKRAAFGNSRTVFKIPINPQGFHDNAWEYRNYKNRTAKSFPMARCRIIDIKDIPILVMEHIAPIPYDESPKWADWVDCRQVGKNRKGKIVAFDYA